MRKIPILSLLLAGLGLALACGKGGSQADPSATPPTASAVVQAVVGGTEDSPQVNRAALGSLAGVTLDGRTASSSVIQPGVIISATAVGGALPASGTPVNFQGVAVRSSFLGPIEALDTAAGTLAVMGQAMATDAQTRFAQENADGSHTTLAITDLAVGDIVMVFGTARTTGFLATRVERAKAGADSTQRGISGAIANLDLTAKTFTVGAWSVAYGAAEVHGTPAAGASVEVRGTVAGTVLTASIVNVAPPPGAPGAQGALRGRVESLDATARTFRLMDLTVNYASATVTGTLLEGAMVEVQGTLATDGSKVLTATQVTVTIPPQAPPACPGDRQAKGPITALDLTAMTLTVDKATFWMDASTVILARDVAIAASDLKVGAWVAVVADSSKKDAANHAYALRIEVIQAPGDGTRPPQKLMGPVTALDATARTLVVQGFTVSVTSATTYVAKGAALDAAAFWSTVAVGGQVEATGSGDVAAKTFTATRIALGAQGGMGGGPAGPGGGH